MGVGCLAKMEGGRRVKWVDGVRGRAKLRAWRAF